MGLTGSLYTSLSGLNTNSEGISVTGNNIANVNTTSFKASRANFETQISQTFRLPSAPSAELGGTNALQVGLGVRLGSISRNFNDGTIQPTGVNTDLAIEGDGFFVLNFNGSQRYTRAGTFGLDRDFNLVNPGGGIVQGFNVDDDFNVVEGVTGNVRIPLGSLTIAEATQNVRFSGNLNADGDAATVGSLITSAPIYSDALATTPAAAADNLVDLFDAGGTSLFSIGDVISVDGAQKGGATLPGKTFEVTDPLTPNTTTTSPDGFGATLSDFLAFLEDMLGIDTSVGGGVSVDGLGQVTVEGNTGEANDLVLDNANIVVNKTTNPTLPFDLSKQREADGESVRTTFVMFDSLGSELVVDLSIVLEDKSNTGTSWRFYANSDNDSDLDRVLGSGTLEFDVNGQLATVSDNNITIDRAGTGAATPQQVTLNFSDPDNGVSALSDTTSQMAAISQDGSPIGTLEDFSVSQDGTIVGVFSNSLLRDLGRVVLANFVNPEGLIDMGSNLFNVSVASGNAVVTTPGLAGTGNVVGGALELSNVDLSQEFINLITYSTGFTASSRALTTSDRMIQELLATIR